MNLDVAVRLCETLMGVALVQQSAEHMVAPARERLLFLPRLGLALLLIVGFQPVIVEAFLLLLGVAMLYRFHGPYNGGSDRLSLLLLFCLLSFHLAPSLRWQEIAMGYLAVQVTLSYAISGWVKLANPDWRNGRAVSDILQFSVYPVSENIRALARAPRLLTYVSWGLILFESCFPLALLDEVALAIALLAAATFHLVNAICFGLNRFLWIWVASYPSLLWFQHRLMSSAG